MDNAQMLGEVKKLRAELSAEKISQMQYNELAAALRRAPDEYQRTRAQMGLAVGNGSRKRGAAPQGRKNLALALGLNVVLPGAGYWYLGEIYRGVLALLLALLPVFFAPLIVAGNVMLFLLICYSTDVYMLWKKREAALDAADTRLCPHCAERVQRAAVVCKHGGSRLDG